MLFFLACHFLPEATTGQPEKPAAPELCTPALLGLSSTQKIQRWALPDGCYPKTPLPQDQPLIIASEDQFQAAFDCHGKQQSGIDYNQKELWAMGYTLSPAGAGNYQVDDGNTVTTIHLFRDPCPDTPMAMPIPGVTSYLMPVGSKRSFASTTCTYPQNCK